LTLATRCTSCATVFRVVQDHLKVSEGWVRCGRCDTVFNALEQLFDLDRDGLPPNADTGEPTPHDSLPALPDEGAPRPALPAAFEALMRDRAAAPAAPMRAPEPDPVPPPIELLLDLPGTDRLSVGEPGAPVAHASIDTAAAVEDAPPPEFLRHAERSARWQRPGLRRAVLAACVLLAALLAAQTMVHFRDSLAARAPGLRPLLAGWCAATGCSLEAPRRIADVTVESTGLVPAAGSAGAGAAAGAGAGAGTFQLSLTLRNRGTWAVSMPSVDLTLTDSNGQLVARRALRPQEFSVLDAAGRRAAPAVLTPDRDTRLQATLATSGRVVGYSVEVFYP